MLKRIKGFSSIQLTIYCGAENKKAGNNTGFF